ncbi:hypothetical protein OAV76_03075 [Schleiferiaceae bacterium]|nr:hypothetical protein [Schleiferiaceae bacterium]
MVNHIGIDESGKAADYKKAHLLSVLTHHIISNYPDGQYYLKKPITSDFLEYMYGSRVVRQLITPLKQEGIIEVNESYSTDLSFCKEYGFNKDIIQEIITEEYTEVYIIKNTLINRINDWQRETLSRQIKQYRFIESEADMLLHLNIDTSALEQLYEQRIEDIKQSDEKKKKLAITNAKRNKEEILQLTEAKDLLDARVRYISGRVYHPFVNCPKEFRKSVVDDEGQPYVEVDLRSSQAVFLCKVIAVALKHKLITFEYGKRAEASDNLIEQIIPLLDEPINVLEEGVYPSDFRAFVSAVFFDDIYEDANPENISQNAYIQVGDEVYLTHSSARLSGSIALVGEERKKAKERFFKDIFYSYYNKENYGVKGQLSISSEYLEDFAKTYYTIYEFCRICALQSKEGKKKSRDLALLLQQTESKFFHELLPTVLTELEPFNYFVVHDAIYVPQKHQEAVIDACNKLSTEFFGVTPKFR